MNHSHIIRSWYLENKRDLPWRATCDPYLIWVSEVILQQTRVAQGLSYYNNFSSRFPNVEDLAKADETDILQLWQGLGYYSRARNMHKAAKMVVNKLNGKFPTAYDDLIQLPGIGDYTASAISSFVNNEARAVLDGNVFRVLSRIFDINTPIDSTKGRKLFKELAQELLENTHAGWHNQAIMEFGALLCTPKTPNCSICPLQKNCLALANGTVKELPFKAKKNKQKKRHFFFLDIRQGEHIFIEQRIEKDIWQSLYQFHLIEQEQEQRIETFLASKEFSSFFKGVEIRIKNISSADKHILSHQIILAHFIEVEVINSNEAIDRLIKIKKDKINEYPVSRLIEKYLLSIK